MEPAGLRHPAFLPARTFDWWRAWVLIGVLLVATIVTMVSVMRTRPELLKERLKGLIQKGQPRSDRIIVLLFMVTYLGSVAFIPIDVFYLHILPKPNLVVSSLGLALVIVGWTIISLVFKENDFAAPVVRHQAEASTMSSIRAFTRLSAIPCTLAWRSTT